MRHRWRGMVTLCLLAAQGAGAQEVNGRVVGVADGDTLTVLVDRRPVKVRLVEIDAPEKPQAFGNKPKRSLADLCYDKTATRIDKGLDKYGRTLALIDCAAMLRGIQSAVIRRTSPSVSKT